MNTFEAIRELSTFRGLLDSRRIEEEHLRQIVAAARWAPSGHNSQPWEFVIVDDADLIGRIAEIATGIFDDFLASHPHLPRWATRFHSWLRWSREELDNRGDGGYVQNWSREEWQELASLADEQAIREWMIAHFGSGGRPSKIIGTAPCLIFTLLNGRRTIPDYSADMLALTSAGAAMHNLRLAAFELGIAVHEQSLLYDLPETREAMCGLLSIPGHCRIVGAMRLGYPARPAKYGFSHVRRPAAEFMHRNSYRMERS